LFEDGALTGGGGRHNPGAPEALIDSGAVNPSGGIPVVPMPMVVMDRHVALLPISSADTQLGAFEVHAGGMLAALCALFEQLWHAASPLHQPLRRNDDGLTAQEVEVLRLLSCGLTDEAVARKLGLSARTVRRTIASLNDRLRANSRFQAGAQAARNGWI
jgi:DNA-binding CsgD family transcriptional regulator